MKFFAFEDIEQNGSCIRYVKECLHQEVKDNRCVATWRGGKNFNVALTDRGWYDHKTKSKGGLIKLCAMAEFNDDIQQAQQRLGEWLGLTPKSCTVRKTYDYRTQSLKYQEFIQRGYKEVKKYVYTDENGTPVHFVIRMEHPTQKKEFMQCTPFSGSLRDVETKLYNLPIIMQSDWAVVVEGEKDADTLISWGIPATTCNNGSDHWKESYTEALRGKDIVICRDNDDAGNDHAHLLLRSLANAARSLRVICPSKRNKGDVTDWRDEEGGNSKKFLKMCQDAQLITPEEAMWSDEALALYRAKKANEMPFCNYRVETKIVKGKEVRKNVPRTITEMIEEIHTRFLGFPRRLGTGTLFDHDRNTDKIEFIQNSASLFAWIGEKSKHAVMWERGVGLATKDEFYQSLMRNSICYEKVSEVPNYPMRHDVYYTFRDQLKSTEGHKAFNTFMSFFNPENEASEVLMRTMVASMMYYRTGIQRPCWIIDSKNGQAAGKTTFAEMVSYLYKCSPIKTNKAELERDAKELNKRLVSITGRNSLMLLVDNVRGTFENSFFADLVTGFNISGKAPYGFGEESRPNDLTYVITSNSANVGSDMASRSFPFYIKPPERRDNNWKGSVMGFVDGHRYEILGDIYDMLKNTKTPEDFVAHTRVPEFEAEVMYKMAASPEVYKQVIEEVLTTRDEVNVDEERAIQVMEIIRYNVRDIFSSSTGTDSQWLRADPDPDHWVFFLRTDAVERWTSKMNPKTDIQDIRNMVNVGRINCIDKKIRRYPKNFRNALRASGILVYGDCIDTHRPPFVPIIGCIGDRPPIVITMIEDRTISMYNPNSANPSDAPRITDGNTIEAKLVEPDHPDYDLEDI